MLMRSIISHMQVDAATTWIAYNYPNLLGAAVGANSPAVDITGGDGTPGQYEFTLNDAIFYLGRNPEITTEVGD